MKPNVPKLVFAILGAIYFLWIALKPMDGSFLDIVDLPIHETGHIVFRIFGEFIGIAGGTLFQLIVPAVFIGYFIWNEKPYSAAFTTFWLGQSLLNVWIYADDAIRMQLVLISGFTGSEGSFHDWNYMLTETALLPKTAVIAGVIRVIATLTIIAAAVLSVVYSFESEENTRKFPRI